MIWVMIGILVVLVAMLGLGCYVFFFPVPPVKEEREEVKHLAQMVEMMREAKEQEERERQEKELADYGLRRINREAEGIISSNRDPGPIKGTKDYIPYGLSEKDRALLDEFYNGS